MLEQRAIKFNRTQIANLIIFAKFFCLVAQSDQTKKASLIMILADFRAAYFNFNCSYVSVVDA